MREERFSVPLNLKQVRITDEFWHREQELVRTEVIPYQWEALNDHIPDAAPSFCMHNFKAAGKMMKEKKKKGNAYVEPTYTFRGFEALPEDAEHPEEDRFYGFVFQDTDFSKWIEAVAYSLTQHPDEALEKIADEAIDVVCAAQLENGYLDTYYIINGMDKAFTNLRDHHELYCLGHLVEGAVAYYEATGKDKLLKAACRFADYVDSYFGPKEGQCKGYPGHEIAEMALVRLYQVTGKEKYLKLSQFFLQQRGTQPYYFDTEEEVRASYAGGKVIPNKNPMRYAYHQAHKTVYAQDEAVGHAVRAVYLYSGMADVARLTKDEKMLEACERLWDSITKEKLYITGGIGGTHLGEAFSFPFDLPNDTAYSETCAAIGLAFFARRMLEIKPDRKYADVMELALYNTVLSGMALDGKSFFYVNPLEVVPEACHKDERKFHVKPVRQKWFGCACCPPNIARIVSSVPSYAYTENEDTLWVHLYMGSKLTKKVGNKELQLTVTTRMPWEGSALLEVTTEESTGIEATISLRIPGWTEEEKSSILVKHQGNKKNMTRVSEDGYVYLSGVWESGDTIEVTFPMEVQMVSADTRVRENVGKVAFMRGPVTYCMEEIDNGKDLHLCRVDVDSIEKVRIEKNTELGLPLMFLKVPGKRDKKVEGEGLYTKYKQSELIPTELTFVPYFVWNNRGEGEMSVWVRV